MITEVGNLSARGVSFYADENLSYEIPQSSFVHIQKNGLLEFYISSKERLDLNGRTGKILLLEENYRAFLLDVVQEVDGEHFRNYDMIDSISLETTFDTDGLIRTLLKDNLDSEFWKVLMLISTPIMGKVKSLKKILQKCLIEPERRRFYPCSQVKGADIDVYSDGFIPKGFWPSGEWEPIGYYNFLTDYFEDPHDRERVSIWDQWISNPYIVSGMTLDFIDKGFSYEGKGSRTNFNYLNNIRPTHNELLNEAWKYGGFDISWYEYRVQKGNVFNRMLEWYGGGRPISSGVRKLTFHADPRTVHGFTDIAQIELRPIYDRDKGILEKYLGPVECVSTGKSGGCSVWSYGGVAPSYKFSEQELASLNSPSEPIPYSVSLNKCFTVLYADGFESLTNEFIQSSYVYDLIKEKGPSPIELMYAIEENHGMIGGQVIYDRGIGNESDYFLTFRSFLDRQGWTIDDFMSLYSSPIGERKKELRKSIVNSGEEIRVKDYSEFYDYTHRAPFDNIEFYAPIPIPGPGADSKLNIETKHAEISQDGSVKVSDSTEIESNSTQHKIPIEKDHFISSVKADCLGAMISRFVKTKVSVQFNDIFPNMDKVKFRISTSDFTYISEREIKTK